MVDDVIAQIKTTESAGIFKEELELLLRSLYLGSNAFGLTLKTKVRAKVSNHIKRAISEEDINIEKFLKGLIESVEKVPTVRLVITYEPTEDAIDRFHSFIINACQRYVFLNIGYSPDNIGGAVIIYEGRYRDYTFKRIFEREFQSNRDNILKLLEK